MLFLLIHVGEETYAIDAREIVEILPLVGVKKQPGSPAGIVGLLDYRGAFVPVVDLSDILIGRPAEPRLSTRIILVSHGRRGGETQLLGVIGENVTEMKKLDPAAFVASGIESASAQFLGSIAHGTSGTIQQIEVGKLPRGTSLHQGVS